MCMMAYAKMQDNLLMDTDQVTRHGVKSIEMYLNTNLLRDSNTNTFQNPIFWCSGSKRLIKNNRHGFSS